MAGERQETAQRCAVCAELIAGGAVIIVGAAIYHASCYTGQGDEA